MPFNPVYLSQVVEKKMLKVEAADTSAASVAKYMLTLFLVGTFVLMFELPS